jgi:hypothetical protein
MLRIMPAPEEEKGADAEERNSWPTIRHPVRGGKEKGGPERKSVRPGGELLRRKTFGDHFFVDRGRKHQ